ncbi:Mut7-C RNAse domain-containing protein [Chloroflexota bacterium]
MVDQNVGKLAKWLRLMGYDTRLFGEGDDSHMVAIAVKEDRVLLTRDAEIMKRRVVSCGRLMAVLIKTEEPEQQIRQVIKSLNLDWRLRSFALCLECNRSLVAKNKAEVMDLVPPYVFETQDQYMECPHCHRIYWRGTHWQAMTRKIAELFQRSTG